MTRRLLPRLERRDSILSAATKAFARGGYAGTGLEEVAAEAGVTRVILYRHFDSKKQLYHAVLERVHRRLTAATRTSDGFDATSIEGMVQAAAADPDGFRLYFRHAAREPEFQAQAEELARMMRDRARPYLTQALDDRRRLEWAAALVPAVAVETVIAWLDADRPDPDSVADTVRTILSSITRAIRSGGDASAAGGSASDDRSRGPVATVEGPSSGDRTPAV